MMKAPITVLKSFSVNHLAGHWLTGLLLTCCCFAGSPAAGGAEYCGRHNCQKIAQGEGLPVLCQKCEEEKKELDDLGEMMANSLLIRDDRQESQNNPSSVMVSGAAIGRVEIDAPGRRQAMLEGEWLLTPPPTPVISRSSSMEDTQCACEAATATAMDLPPSSADCSAGASVMGQPVPAVPAVQQLVTVVSLLAQDPVSNFAANYLQASGHNFQINVPANPINPSLVTLLSASGNHPPDTQSLAALSAAPITTEAEIQQLLSMGAAVVLHVLSGESSLQFYQISFTSVADSVHLQTGCGQLSVHFPVRLLEEVLQLFMMRGLYYVPYSLFNIEATLHDFLQAQAPDNHQLLLATPELLQLAGQPHDQGLAQTMAELGYPQVDFGDEQQLQQFILSPTSLLLVINLGMGHQHALLIEASASGQFVIASGARRYPRNLEQILQFLYWLLMNNPFTVRFFGGAGGG